MDPMFTMRPQRLAIMSGAAARLQSQPPVRLTSMTRRHSSSATWVIQGVGDRRLGETRALFTKMSIGPKRWCTESKGQRRLRGGRARHPAGLRAPGPSSPYLRRLISGGRLQRASRVRRSRVLIRLHGRRDFLQSSARGGVSVNGYSWAGVIGALEQTPLDGAQEESAMYGLLWMVGGAAVVVALWASMAGAQDVWPDRRDIARDVRDIQQDERDLARDNREIREDRADIWRDERDIQQDRRDIGRDERELHQDRRQLREDMRAGDWGAVARDRAEIRRDRRDLYQDRQELARDERDLRNDRQELRHDLIDRNRDRRELYRDERDLRADRRDLRQDLRNRWANHHPGFSNRFQDRYEPYGQHQGWSQYQNGQHQGYGERWYGQNSQSIGQHQGGGQHQWYGHNSQGSDQHQFTGQNSQGPGQGSQGTGQNSEGTGQNSQGTSGQHQGSSQYAQGSGQRSMYGQGSQGSSQAPRTYARASGYGQSAQSSSRPAGYSQASYAPPSGMMSGRTMQARSGRR